MYVCMGLTSVCAHLCSVCPWLCVGVCRCSQWGCMHKCVELHSLSACHACRDASGHALRVLTMQDRVPKGTERGQCELGDNKDHTRTLSVCLSASVPCQCGCALTAGAHTALWGCKVSWVLLSQALCSPCTRVSHSGWKWCSEAMERVFSATIRMTSQ